MYFKFKSEKYNIKYILFIYNVNIIIKDQNCKLSNNGMHDDLISQHATATVTIAIHTHMQNLHWELLLCSQYS